MKTAVILVLLAITACTLASESKFQNKLASMMSMRTSALDAVDTALQLLRDLKQANFEAQAAMDAINVTMEEEHGQLIMDLTSIADSNKATGDDSTNHRKHIESEIQATQEYLVWINNRRVEIHRKTATLQEHRCYANLAFVKALKEHDEALEVVRFLKEDLDSIVQSGSFLDVTKIKDSASKLGAYAHMFNDQAMKSFEQLTDDEDYEDNDQGALELEKAPKSERSVGTTIVDAVNHLEEKLIEAIEELKVNEIRNNWALVDWLQDTEEELEHLDSEQSTKTTYMDNLLIAIVSAKAHEDKAWEIYFESVQTLNNAVDNLNKIREAYELDHAVRDEENQILDDIIQMFIEKVSTLDSTMRDMVDEQGE